MLKEKLELLVERLTDREMAQRVHALDQLKLEISGATKTMTSVPKPLKFLSPHFPKIKAAYEAETDSTIKVSRKDLYINDLTKILALGKMCRLGKYHSDGVWRRRRP